MKNPVYVRFDADDQPGLIEIGVRDLVTVSIAQLNPSREVISRYAFAGELCDISDDHDTRDIVPIKTQALQEPPVADGFTYDGEDIDHE
jgi:hypothetical protein